MKNKKLSAKELILVVFLVVLLAGVSYYMFYYTPLQEEMEQISSQSVEVDDQTTVATAKLASMSRMQKELDEIFAKPQSEITEIAPYDNAKVIMNELNGILSRSINYKLTFADPVIGKDGTVRRTVSMNFNCSNYTAAKQIISNLTSGHWRCLMKNVSISSDTNVRTEEVVCSATIVFFESTNIQ